MKKEKVRKKKRIFQTCVRLMYSHRHAAKYGRYLWPMQLTDALRNDVYTNFISSQPRISTSTELKMAVSHCRHF